MPNSPTVWHRLLLYGPQCNPFIHLRSLGVIHKFAVRIHLDVQMQPYKDGNHGNQPLPLFALAISSIDRHIYNFCVLFVCALEPVI